MYYLKIGWIFDIYSIFSAGVPILNNNKWRNLDKSDFQIMRSYH
jgi:hypothetical protein